MVFDILYRAKAKMNRDNVEYQSFEQRVNRKDFENFLQSNRFFPTEKNKTIRFADRSS